MKEREGKSYGKNEKIYVIYDEIYDIYIKEKKKKNCYCKILRFLNPSVLILKVLSEIYNLKDRIEYISCSSFQMVKEHTYINGEKKGIYETLLILYSINKSNLKINNNINIFNDSLIKNVDTDIIDLNMYHILNEFNDIYEYLLIIYKNCYENYTKKFFINKDYNLIKGYIKLQKFKKYVLKKYKNISFDTILNKFIKLLNLFTKLKNNYKQIECIIFYVYFYIFLNIPIYFYPWNNISDNLNKKIFKDGNVNMITNIIEKNKNNFFSCILNRTEGTSDYFETYEFNIALFINNEQEKNNEISLNQDKMMPKDLYNNLFCKNNKYFINLSEYNILKEIGYNSLKQFYIPHFYYLIILKKFLIFNKKMQIMQYLFHILTKSLIKIDEYYKNNIKR
ncbi:conserved Plasmodium protein, unknown function [Plasmodium gallinaceum]|uniref:Uncharacterized protein n=1 Tax=Plasmodium gallinaceum TaxID=5849 RepID=A0A1J1GQH2_PLAGA|nr:conserved Plasmodium protein, unknown function [Plasmodium gallinaceum]CRG94759.1 conserved Plasmodium protein, unknown function [Plasmodium gallinaceum]